ncbi:MAG: hypothetical protein IPH31_10985 [Lewinellaceae bacterium]|nr:hypothetical protein [Lewinellaceae bacterium]
MKQLIFVLLCCSFSGLLPAQTLLQDALVLRQFFDTTDAGDFDKRLIFQGGDFRVSDLNVFRKYVPVKDSLTTATVEQAFKGNPFLRVEVTDQNILSFLPPKRGDGGGPGGGPGISSGAGTGLSVAGFADGLARFLVNRTKQELSQAFFEDFKEAINEQPLLGHFCPATKQHLLFIDQDVYQFNDYLEGLRETFTMDMTALPGNTESYLRTNYSDKEAGKVSIDLLHLSQQMVNGESPIDMIDYLARDGSAIQSAKMTEPVLYDVAGGLRFLNIVSESFIRPNFDDPSAPAAWYTGRELRELFSDPSVFRLYLGLLWQKSNGIAFVGKDGAKPLNMRSILGEAGASADLFAEWRRSLESLGEMTHAIQRSTKGSGPAVIDRFGRATASAIPDDFFRYSQSFNDLLQTLNQTGRLVLQRQNDLIPQDYLALMRQCNSLYFNIRQRNYTGAISNVIYCLNVLGKDKKEVATMLKYTNFVACIAEANSPEEVERAIELFALPPGSSRMKKQPGRFSVALNAYTGLAGGSEWLGGDKSPKTIGAITAPVGLSCSWGLKKGSLGFFVPLLDVGAVTAFRFDDENYQNLPELSWSNILSPGLYAVYDFPGKWPIALGVGGQAGPALRKVSDTGLTINNSGGMRLGAFATVDIPITYFYLGKGKK